MVIAWIAAAILLSSSIAPSLSFRRQRKIQRILHDLKVMATKSAANDYQYAVRQNILFFKSIRTLPGYLAWGITKRLKIDGARLLEIADLPLPQWEKELYQDLAHVERKGFPGLSKPLRNILLKHVQHDSYAYFLDLGCGGMEVERQVLLELSIKDSDPIAFVGVDLAPQAWGSIEETFKDTPIPVYKLDSINELNQREITQPTVFFCCGDAIKMAEEHGSMFDVIFFSRFRHHLSDSKKYQLDGLSKKLKCPIIEYDDYRGMLSWLAPLLTAWYRPVLLNGAIFSQLRQPTKRDLLKQKYDRERVGAKIRIFSPPGSYAKVYNDDLG